jgi:AcrR family transcriptional regulator
VERETQAQRIAQLKRTELLDAAVADMVEVGWHGLQMQGVARRVGVSRQTVYNTFGGRDGLATAVVEHLTDAFLSGFEECFEGETESFDQWSAAIEYMLRRGVEDPAVRAMLGADSGDRFLELLTSGSQPLVTSARARITAVAMRCQPGLDSGRVVEAAEIITRLTLSYIVQPMQSLEEATMHVATMITAFLDAPLRSRTTDAARTGNQHGSQLVDGLPDQRREPAAFSHLAAS